MLQHEDEEKLTQPDNTEITKGCSFPGCHRTFVRDDLYSQHVKRHYEGKRVQNTARDSSNGGKKPRHMQNALEQGTVSQQTGKSDVYRYSLGCASSELLNASTKTYRSRSCSRNKGLAPSYSPVSPRRSAENRSSTLGRCDVSYAFDQSKWGPEHQPIPINFTSQGYVNDPSHEIVPIQPLQSIAFSIPQ